MLITNDMHTTAYAMPQMTVELGLSKSAMLNQHGSPLASPGSIWPRKACRDKPVVMSLTHATK